MTRGHFVIIALALAAGVAPQVAQASCSGNACGAFSATATWSSSDKKVNAVLTNKDQAKPMQVKLCITVDSRCNSFDFTLPPRGSVTKSVSVSGGAAPAKFAVDVNKAEFAVTQGASPPPSSQASTAAPASGPTTGVDVPGYGKFSYLASEAWREAKQTYDGSTRGRFQWKNLDAAIPDAQSTIDLARKTTEAAYSARQAAKALERTGSSNWSTPGDNQRIVTAMYDRSNVIFDRAIKKRQIVELLLKKLEEATAKAKAAL